MYSKLRKILSKNREKPIIGSIYRYLKIREKKKLLRVHPPAVTVDVKGTQELYRRHAEWLQLINTYILGKTLDVGSKYGLVTKVEDVVALDIVKDYLRLNVHKAKVMADACNLPFISASFETVVTTEILEHLEHPNKAVSEIRRVLKDKGRAIMSVPNRYNVFSEPTHIHYFTEKKVRQLYKGFNVVVCSAIPSGHIFGVFEAIE